MSNTRQAGINCTRTSPQRTLLPLPPRAELTHLPSTDLIDAFTIYAASAVASNTFMRSIFASALPLVAMPLFHNLGVAHACTLLGSIAAALGSVPFLFFSK